MEELPNINNYQGVCLLILMQVKWKLKLYVKKLAKFFKLFFIVAKIYNLERKFKEKRASDQCFHFKITHFWS